MKPTMNPEHDGPQVCGTTDKTDGWYLLFEDRDDLWCEAWVRARLEDAVELEGMR